MVGVQSCDIILSDFSHTQIWADIGAVLTGEAVAIGDVNTYAGWDLARAELSARQRRHKDLISAKLFRGAA